VTIRDSKGPLAGAAGFATATAFDDGLDDGFEDGLDAGFAGFLPAAAFGPAIRRGFFALFFAGLRFFAVFRRPAVMP
jgi:hypothetical protein